jgi:hypothetical protein
MGSLESSSFFRKNGNVILGCPSAFQPIAGTKNDLAISSHGCSRVILFRSSMEFKKYTEIFYIFSINMATASSVT